MYEGSDALYLGKYENGKTTRIGSTVSETVHVSYDGKSVYYYVNRSASDSDFNVGRLYCNTGESTVIITEDAVVGGITSNLVYGYIDPKRIWVVSDGYDGVQFYNGKTLKTPTY